MPPVPAELVHGVDSWAWRWPFNRVPLPLPHPGLSGRECSVESRLQISEEANPNPWSLSLALGFPVPTEAGKKEGAGRGRKRRRAGARGRGGGGGETFGGPRRLIPGREKRLECWAPSPCSLMARGLQAWGPRTRAGTNGI